MKRSIILSLVLLTFVFSACEMQKPKEEYLDMIQQNKDAGNTVEMIENYQKLLKYYPDDEKIQTYRQNYIQTLFVALNDESIDNSDYAERISMTVEKLEGDTTKTWIKYRLYDHYTEIGETEKAETILETLDQKAYMMVAQKLLADQKPKKTIEVYKMILEKFPEGDDLDKVHFLIAFTNSENLKNFEEAREYFTNVVEEYPESDLADDAKWMLENMEKSPDEISFMPEGETKDEEQAQE